MGDRSDNPSPGILQDSFAIEKYTPPQQNTVLLRCVTLGICHPSPSSITLSVIINMTDIQQVTKNVTDKTDFR